MVRDGNVELAGQEKGQIIQRPRDDCVDQMLTSESESQSVYLFLIYLFFVFRSIDFFFF